MSYREDNKMFLDMLDAVREALKDTAYKVCISSLSEPDEPYDEDNPSDAWKEFTEIDDDPSLHECEVRFDYWGQKILIVDPTVQRPIYDNVYKDALVVFTENYEHFDRYEISRLANYRYDTICCESEPEPKSEEWFIKYSDAMDYAKNELLNDLKFLSYLTKKLATLHDESCNLSRLKYTKDDYYDRK